VNTIYYIKTGRTKLYIPLPSGTDRTIAYHTQGATLGNVNAFSRIPTIAYCVAITDCVLLSCPVNVYWDRLVKHNLVFTCISLEAKKASHLFHFQAALDNKSLFIKRMLEEGLTHQEIADLMGYTRVQVSRICSRIKHETIMETRRSYLLSKNGDNGLT
jgi:CRP-like cAMP-binding protein